jgi:chorismate synthase
MAGNSYGHYLGNNFGESHGEALGNRWLSIRNRDKTLRQSNSEMSRRKPGQSAIVTQRKEPDDVQFLSGIFEGKTTGTQ